MSKNVTAKLKYLRVGPRKARLVADLVRGKKVNKALELLSLTSKRAARPILKLVRSAVANAEHNFLLNKDNLKISAITVDGGPVLKRWMPKAHGRATPVRERTSHVNVVLEEVVKQLSGKDKVKNSKS